MTITRENVAAAIKLVATVGQLVRELREVPSGVLYAQLMPIMSLATYDRAIESLITAGLVVRKNQVLTWVGE